MNKVMLIGNITRDLELNYPPNKDMAIVKFGIAVKRAMKKNESDFINCVVFGKRAETMATYLQKGSKIAITGSIQTGSYEAKDGTKRYTTDVIVDEFEFLDSKKKSEDTPFEVDDTNINMTPVSGEDIPF